MCDSITCEQCGLKYYTNNDQYECIVALHELDRCVNVLPYHKCLLLRERARFLHRQAVIQGINIQEESVEVNNAGINNTIRKISESVPLQEKAPSVISELDQITRSLEQSKNNMALILEYIVNLVGINPPIDRQGNALQSDIGGEVGERLTELHTLADVIAYYQEEINIAAKRFNG